MNNMKPSIVLLELGSTHMFKESPSIQYLGAYLKQRGLAPHLLFTEETEPAIERMKKLQPSIVGASCLSVEQRDNFGQKMKKFLPKTRLVTGGYDITGRVQEGESNNGPFDTWVTTYGEESLWRLCQMKGEWPTMFCADNPPFDSLPHPLRVGARILKSKCHHIVFPPPSMQKGVAFISRVRGCRGGCTFCATNSMCGGRVELRKSEDVIEEISVLVRDYGVNLIWFCDEAVNVDSASLQDFCERMVASKLPEKVRLIAGINARDMDFAVLGKMKQAGFIQLGTGVESGKDDIRRRLKGSLACSTEELIELNSYCDELGIVTVGFTLYGLPWDDMESITESYRRIKKLGFDQLRVARAMAFHGTKLRTKYQEQVRGGTFDIGIEDRKLENLRRRFLIDYYHDTRYQKRIEKKVEKSPELVDSFREGIKCLTEAL